MKPVKPLPGSRYIRKQRTDPLESAIERKVCQRAMVLGFTHYKFTSPTRRSVPDRIFINPHGWFGMVEFKRLGGKPTDAQWREINKLRERRIPVYVIDNVASGEQLLEACANLHPGQFPDSPPPDP